MNAPIYLKLKKDLESSIAKGKFLPGETLPSENELSEKYNISRSSVRIVLSELGEEGLIEKRPGKKTVVSNPRQNAHLPAKPATIGVDIAGHLFTSGYQYYQLLMNGIMSASLDLNCRIQVVSDIKKIDAQQIEGLIIAKYEDRLQKDILSIGEKIPVIVINRVITQEYIGFVSTNHTFETFKAVEYMIQQGHTRIGFIGNNKADGFQRQQGYFSALKTYGIPCNERLVISQNPSNALFDEIKKILKKTDITAVFVASGEYFISFLDPVLRELQIKIPEELSVICFDDIEPDCFHYGPSLSCVRMPLFQMGCAAVESIASSGKTIMRKNFDAELVLRQSFRNLKRPAIKMEEGMEQ